jgi:hypothetical protein
MQPATAPRTVILPYPLFSFRNTYVIPVLVWMVVNMIRFQRFGGPRCLHLHLRNVGSLPHHYMASQPRRPHIRGPFEKFVDSPYYSVYVFQKWVERCKKCIPCKGCTSKKRPSPHLHKVRSGESTNFSSGLRNCSTILKRVLLKRP